MPKIDLDKVSDSAEFELLIPGSYPMECVRAEAKTSNAGNEVWHLDLLAYREGVHVFDNLTWTPKAMSRVKLALKGFGVALSGEQNYTPEMLIGRRATVTVITETWEGKQRNKVVFAGYEPLSTRPIPSDVSF